MIKKRTNLKFEKYEGNKHSTTPKRWGTPLTRQWSPVLIVGFASFVAKKTYQVKTQPSLKIFIKVCRPNWGIPYDKLSQTTKTCTFLL